MKRIIVFVAAVALTGCAPSAQFVELKKTEIKEAGKTKRTIVRLYYGKKTEEEVAEKEAEEELFGEDLSHLPPAEGDSGLPCSNKCIDNCDDNCRIECPDLWGELCGPYVPPTAEDFDFGEKTVEQPVEIEGYEPQPDSVTVENRASGDNNNQTNVVGDNNRILVQGGGGANNTTPDPIVQAMAGILRSKVPPLRSNAEIFGGQLRGLIGDTADAAVKMAPAVLTGAAIITTGAAVREGFREAGDKNSNNPYYDLSDNSVNTQPEAEIAE